MLSGVPKSKPGKRSRRKPVASVESIPWLDNLPQGDYVETVDRLCVLLELPSFANRHGLKKVHSDFSTVHGRLEEAFEHSRRSGDIQTMGAVITLYSKACIMDTILQDRFIGAGFIPQLMSLVENPDSRRLALRALNAIAHHSGKRFQSEIIRFIAPLTDVLNARREDPADAALAMGTLCHIYQFLPIMPKKSDGKLLMRTVFKAFSEPSANEYLVDHAFSLIRYLSRHKAIVQEREYQLFMVALLRSQNSEWRITAICTLFEILANAHPEMKGQKKQGVSAATLALPADVPADLAAIMDAFGRERCEMAETRRAATGVLAAQVLHAGAQDAAALGRALCGEILRAEWALPEPLCIGCARAHHCGRATGAGWEAALTAGADALRLTGVLADVDAADVLAWKHTLLRCRHEALKVACDISERRPGSGFWYLAVAMDTPRAEALRAAKKGLRCEGNAPWVRRALLRRACASALGEVIEHRRSCTHAEELSLVQSAYEDACALKQELPPDSVHALGDHSLYIMLRFAVDGHNISVNFREVQDAFDGIALHDKFMDAIRRPFRFDDIQEVHVRQTVVELSAEAQARWGKIMARLDELTGGGMYEGLPPAPSVDGGEGSLVAWLEDRAEDDARWEIPQRTRRLIDLGDSKIMRCSWCARTSAVLKKCNGCGEVEYCDGACQKTHWEVAHRQVCKGRRLRKAKSSHTITTEASVLGASITALPEATASGL